MMNEGPLGENDEKMMREKARTSGFISDFTRCKETESAEIQPHIRDHPTWKAVQAVY
jgi:hypothetical protein